MLLEESPDTSLVSIVDRPLVKWIGAISAIVSLLFLVASWKPIKRLIVGEDVDFCVEKISEIPVFNVNQKISGLSISYNKEDLTASHKQIFAARIRFRNSGNESIPADSVSSLDPVGIRVINGSILRMSFLSATSEHLKRFAVPLVRDAHLINIPKGAIFDSGDSIVLDLLVLSEPSRQPSYLPTGKIKGIRAIGFSDVSNGERQVGFIDRTFSGDLFVQLARAISYIVFLFGSIAIFVSATLYFQSWKERNVRKIIEEISVSPAYSNIKEVRSVVKYILSIYISVGDVLFSQFISYIELLSITGSVVDRSGNEKMQYIADRFDDDQYGFMLALRDRHFTSQEDVRSVLYKLRRHGLVNLREGAVSKDLLPLLRDVSANAAAKDLYMEDVQRFSESSLTFFRTSLKNAREIAPKFPRSERTVRPASAIKGSAA